MPRRARSPRAIGRRLPRDGTMTRRSPRRPLLGALAVWLVASGVALAVEPETVGQVMTLPERPAPHWFWLSDILLHRTALFDADSGGLLGQISSGTAGSASSSPRPSRPT